MDNNRNYSCSQILLLNVSWKNFEGSFKYRKYVYKRPCHHDRPDCMLMLSTKFISLVVHPGDPIKKMLTYTST